MSIDHPLPPSTVHVVDDDLSVRRALGRLLGARGYAVHLYESATEFLARRPDGPGCVVLDLQMPGVPGLDLLQQLSGTGRPLRVVVLSGHADVTAAVMAMKLGALDLLTKPVEDPVLCAAVANACRASTEAWERGLSRDQFIRRLETLTPRELEVAWMVSCGFLNKQIAYDLGIAEKTVKGHRGTATRKLDVQSVAELVRLLDSSELDPPERVRPLIEAARAERAAAHSTATKVP